jgi:phytoene synthase
MSEPAPIDSVTAPPQADDSDHEVCRLLHKEYGTSYYLSSRLFEPEIRKGVDAIYGFVRVPDNWVDLPGAGSSVQTFEKLWTWQVKMRSALAGKEVDEPVLRAFAETVHKFNIPHDEPFLFLEAMNMDRRVDQYDNYEQLKSYMRGSAVAVGNMMCPVIGAPTDQDTLDRARCLSEAMQMTNFLRDIKEDLSLGRVYMPADELDQFGLSKADLEKGSVTDRFRRFMEFQIARCRELYRESEPGIARIPGRQGKAVFCARVLYAEILTEIEDRDFDIFTERVRVPRSRKFAKVLQAMFEGRQV